VVIVQEARGWGTELKPFLVTLAIVDDLGAAMIFAVFCANELSMAAAVVAGVALSRSRPVANCPL